MLIIWLIRFSISCSELCVIFKKCCISTMTISLILFREWSDEGLETIILSDNEVECVTNHLTSFAVLVDHRGLLETGVLITHTLSLLQIFVSFCRVFLKKKQLHYLSLAMLDLPFQLCVYYWQLYS